MSGSPVRQDADEARGGATGQHVRVPETGRNAVQAQDAVDLESGASRDLASEEM